MFVCGLALPREYICSIFEFETETHQRALHDANKTLKRTYYCWLHPFIYKCVDICRCRNILLFHIDIKGRVTAGYIRLFSFINVCIYMYRHVQLFHIDIYIPFLNDMGISGCASSAHSIV